MKFKLRRYYLYYLGRALAFVFSLIPLSAAVYFGSLLGNIAYCLLGKYRRITLYNLNKALGNEKSEKELQDIARGVFKNLGRNAAELINFPKIGASNIDKYVLLKNKEILDNELKKGKGVLLLTAHFGSWELLAITFRLKGYPGTVIGRKIYFKKYDDYLNRLRKIHDVNIIYRGESVKRVLRALKNNHILGIVADQDMDSVEGVFITFFGQSTYTPTGPVALARASGASIVPAFIIRERNGHALVIEKPIELTDTGDKDKDMVTNTQKWSDVVEGYIRRYPDQWVWMHKRWKTKKN